MQFVKVLLGNFVEEAMIPPELVRYDGPPDVRRKCARAIPHAARLPAIRWRGRAASGIMDAEVGESYQPLLTMLSRKIAFVREREGQGIPAIETVAPEVERLRLKVLWRSPAQGGCAAEGADVRASQTPGLPRRRRTACASSCWT